MEEKLPEELQQLLNIKLLGKRIPIIDKDGKVTIVIEHEGKYYLESVAK